ncbi:hypothetical protein ACGFYU_31240 [Streptomyces sp. NPDC048337]
MRACTSPIEACLSVLEPLSSRKPGAEDLKPFIHGLSPYGPSY